MLEVSIKISCHTDVRSCVYTVCCKSDLDESVCSKSEVVLCWSSYHSIRIKYHNAVVRLSDSELILCADHTE